MNIDNLYKRLETIFVDYTTHQWKNGWQHEGDRLSKELTIQKNVPFNNLFLLEKTNILSKSDIKGCKSISIRGPHSLNIEIKEGIGRIRIDIEVKHISDLDVFYFVDNELDWLTQQDFIIHFCKNFYEANVLLHEIMSIPAGVFGGTNPEFANAFRREIQLNKILND